MKIVTFPIIQWENWAFRTTIINEKDIMIMAFSTEAYLLRFFSDKDLAKAWIDETCAGKHVD
jgi:hypothetical protein